MAIRLDRSRLGKATPTSNGGLRIPASLTRVGVFEYIDENGKKFRELKSPEEVFHADTLASLKQAAVTDLHPTTFVGPDNYKQLAVGNVTDAVAQDGEFVSAELVINDPKMIAMIDAGARREVSLGFSCELDYTPGEFNGVKYDAVQRKIRHNHAAIGPDGWGRCGSSVALRVDGQDAPIIGEKIDEVAPVAPPKPKGRKMHKIKYSDCGSKVTIDGVEYALKGDASQATQALVSAHARVDGGDEAVNAALASAEATALAFAVKAANPVQAVLPQTVVDSAVREALAVLDHARAVCAADTKFESFAPSDVIRAALLANGVEAAKLDGKSSDYVRGLFDALSPKKTETPAPAPDKKSTFDHAPIVDAKEPEAFTAAEYQAHQRRKLDQAAPIPALARSIVR